MALSFKRTTKTDFESGRVFFKSSQKVFTTQDKNSDETIDFKYALEPDKKYKTRETQFEIFLFHKDEFATNNIFQVKIENKRIGWLFPIQALLSAQHDYAKSEDFFPYSFNAYKLLLKNRNNLPYKE